jgi:hypothetical protein
LEPTVIASEAKVLGGLYHFIVKIAGVDSDRTIFPEDKQPIFNEYLSVGTTENYMAVAGGKETPITIISYYDELKNCF